MSTTTGRGQSSTRQTDTRARTTLIRSATRTQRIDSARSTPASSSTSTSSSPSSSPTPTIRIAIASDTPSAVVFEIPSATPTGLDKTCSKDSDCAEGTICSGGICTGGTQSDLFESIGSGSTKHAGAGTAIGVTMGVVGIAIILFLFVFWCVRRRRQPVTSTEAPPPGVDRSVSTRNKQTEVRSASAATKRTRDRAGSAGTQWSVDNDQKTLVASLPNSPQDVRFLAQRDATADYYSSARKLDEIVEKSEPASVRIGVSRSNTAGTQASRDNKALPMPPTEDVNYALNVRINKSMIFEDSLFTPSRPHTPRERAPRYRFQEVLPRAPGTTPHIAVTKPSKPTAPSVHASEYELENYPQASSRPQSEVETEYRGSIQYGQAQVHDLRGHALKRLEGKLPPLPTSARDAVPPSPSFSFRSYDWYRDIIDQPPAPSHTPNLSGRNHPLGVNPLLSHPLTSNPTLMPAPPSTGPVHQVATYLHPSSALTLDSPTSPDFRLAPTGSDFRLSPTVYQMPSRLPKIVPAPPPRSRPSSGSTVASRRSRRAPNMSWMPNDDISIPENDLPLPPIPRHYSMAASLAMASEAPQTRRTSKATTKSRNSQSWLPEDGVYLPEEDTVDSFTVFKRDFLDKRPTSYSPLG